MNYANLSREDLERIARDRFGDVLNIVKLSNEEIDEELRAYDRFAENKKKGEGNEIQFKKHQVKSYQGRGDYLY